MTDHKGEFPGFPPEPVTNYWPYPKALNGWWRSLTPYEQKVLDYLLRHTWGYRKDADAISHSQFINGIKRRNGTELDGGTGIKDERTIRKALRGLEYKRFIICCPVLGKETIYKLKLDSSQDMIPPARLDTTPPTKDATGYPSQEASSTIKDIPINKNNIHSASQTINNNSYKEKITDLVFYLSSKLGGIQFPNFGKQAKYIKSMLDTGYSSVDIKSAIVLMLENSWWLNHSFDMKNVADEIPKLKANKKLSDPQRPKFIPCNKNGCKDGYILNKAKNSMAMCQCRKVYLETFDTN